MTITKTSTKEQRQRYKSYWAEVARVDAKRRQLEMEYAAKAAEYIINYGMRPPRPQLPPLPGLPVDLQGLVCGGKSRRTDKPCQSREIFTNGRCKWHGGLCTGPKTAKGKAKSAQNLPMLKIMGS